SGGRGSHRGRRAPCRRRAVGRSTRSAAHPVSRGDRAAPRRRVVVPRDRRGPRSTRGDRQSPGPPGDRPATHHARGGSPSRDRGDDRMTTPLEITDREATALADLTVTAPPSLRTSVLVEVGLADRYGRVDSPLGPLVVAWNGVGVVSVDIAGDDGAFEASHLASTGRPAVPSEVPQRLANAIARRLEGDRRVRIPLDLRGHSPFEQDVWKKALEIPRGEVRPYGWIAAEIGRPKAVRAVGTALGHNPVPLIVPCHRVVRSDGSI